MPNIFDGIRKMTDDEVRMEIALLRNVTLLNAAKETSNRVIGGLADIANAFAESISRKTPFDYQVTRVSDMVHREYNSLKVNDRIQLEYELRKVIREKCAEFTQEAAQEDIGEERLSFLVVNEAAKVYNIHKYDTPAEKTEAVYAAFDKALLVSIHSRLVKQNREEIIKTDQKIQDAMNLATLDSKRQLQSALMPKEFSGRCIGRILRLERNVKYLTDTVTYLGLDCFDYVTSNIIAVFSELKNFKRTGRALLAQLVWCAKRAYHGSFKVTEKILPSYITQEKRQEELASEQEFRAVLSGRVQAQDRLTACENDLKISREKEEECRQKEELLKREYEEQQMKFMGLESRKDDYINNRKPEDEKKTYYSEVNDTKRQLDKAQADFERIEKQLAELKEKIERQESERNVALLNFEVVKSKTDDQVKKRTIKLQNNWQAFYFRFAFADDVFEQLVLNFTIDNLLNIERLLKEMHDSKDILAFAYEKNEENATTYCHMKSGKNAVIVYNKTYIVRIGVEM
jgi:hypothetical protein